MLTDLLLTRRAFGRRNSDRGAVDLQSWRGDLCLTSGRANLAQAILNRLMTRQGELSALGHPDYGSRLYQITGKPNTSRTQALADFYIRESLAAEERIDEILAITIVPPSLQADRRNVLDISITVRPVAELAGDEDLSLSLTLNLEG